MASVSYDVAALGRAQKSFGRFQTGEHLPVLSQLISMGGLKLTMDTFRKQRDPYGRPWKPLARERARDKRARLRAERRGKKPRGHKILIDTARMRNSTTAVRMGKTGGVAIPTGYAASHQHGAHIAPYSRLALSTTYRYKNRFITTKRAQKLQERGKEVQADKFRRTYSRGITIPQRMMLPDQSMGLPESWKKMIQRETTGLIKRWVRKGGRR